MDVKFIPHECKVTSIISRNFNIRFLMNVVEKDFYILLMNIQCMNHQSH